MRLIRNTAAIAILALAYGASAAELPEAIAAKGEIVVFQVHAEGAQIYECKAAQDGGQLTWQFREPIASLFHDGKTVGRHFAGPTLEIGDSVVVAKVSGRSPGTSDKDIPWLKLVVTEPVDEGRLIDVTTVQRINTVGGVLEGGCEKSGDFHTEPYAADYVFLRTPQP
jgi:uncharacterized protein DUF3455